MTWDTSVSVTSPVQNTDVSHPLFPANRHPHEGWFLYVEGFGVLHEFTNFTKTSNGASQDSITSTLTTVFNETFVLQLDYGINAVGPDGFPDLAWSGSLSRPLSASPLVVMSVRLFNVFDYDVGEIVGNDTAVATQTTGPNTTLIEIAGQGGVTGKRGVYGNVQYTADTLDDVLDQIQLDNTLNNVAAGGNYDVAGAFQWNMDLCSDPQHPDCPVGGSGTGGFGGFDGYTQVPEPSTGVLVLGGLVFLARRQGRRTA